MIEIKQNISGEVEAISEALQIIRAKFKPLLDKDIYVEDVSRLVDAVGTMIENVEAMTQELERAHKILTDSDKTG